MACVEAAPIPDSHKKVDELFLFWLSEPSTQELLTKELSKVRRLYDLEELDAGASFVSDVQATSSATTAAPRPLSPLGRTPSPPHLLSRSPKSPRVKPRPQSPRRAQSPARRPPSDDHSTGTLGRDEPDSAGAPSKEEGSGSGAGRSAEAGDASPGGAPPNEPDNGADPKLEEMEQPAGATASPKTAPPEVIPRFYFPHGRPVPEADTERQLREVAKVFQASPTGELPLEEFHAVAKVISRVVSWPLSQCPCVCVCTS